jgi:hypothetical protein
VIVDNLVLNRCKTGAAKIWFGVSISCILEVIKGSKNLKRNLQLGEAKSEKNFATRKRSKNLERDCDSKKHQEL